MNEENEKELIDIEPSFFDPGFYFRCGDGWLELLKSVIHWAASKSERWEEVKGIKDRLISEEKFDPEGHHKWIVDFFEEKPEDPWADFRFTQIKEKFGGLRIYVTHYPVPAFKGVISVVENMSYKTCESCGLPGETRQGSWAKTLCDSCAEARDDDS